MGEESKLEVGKSYPGVLIDITSENDEIRGVYKARFKYRVYLSTSEWVEVFDDFYWWNCTSYKRYTLEKVTRVMGAYNLVLIPKDYRNEIVFTKTCKWLIGTRVEITPYRYKGKRYKVVCTERNNQSRIGVLWDCLREDDVNNFLCRLEQDEKEYNEALKYLYESISKEKFTSNDDLVDSFDGIEKLFETLDEESEVKPRKMKNNSRKTHTKKKGM